jgi:hypothetical protein
MPSPRSSSATCGAGRADCLARQARSFELPRSPSSLGADRAFEPAYFVVTPGRKSASRRSSSERRGRDPKFDCSFYSLRITLN